MNIINRLREQTSAAYRMTHSGVGGGIAGSPWWFGSALPGTDHDYAQEAGPTYANNIVYSAISWIGSQYNEAELIDQKRGGDGKWVATSQLHPLAKLVRLPNEEYTGDQFANAINLSLACYGNAYAIVERDRYGEPVHLWYTPNWMIMPHWPGDGSKFVDYYQYFVNGKVINLLPCRNATSQLSILHIRARFLHPLNQRVGYAPLYTVLREIVTDNEAATFMASILRNGAFPGVILSPKPSQTGSPEINDQVASFVKRQMDQYTGDARGRTALMSLPMDITTPSWSPEQLVLEKLRGLSEERVCAALNIAPVTLSLGSGTRNSTAKASYQDSRRNSYETGVIPLQTEFATQVSHQLIGEWTDPETTRLWWDRSAVTAFQLSESERAKNDVLACGGPYMTVNEVRQARGLPPIEGGDEIKSAPANTQDQKDSKDSNKEKDDEETD